MVDEVVVVVVMLVVESGWLSSIDNKVTFPWEAAWRSRESPLSRAAGPLPLRGGTTEGHQPAGGRRSSSSKGYTLRWKTSSERMHGKQVFLDGERDTERIFIPHVQLGQFWSYTQAEHS